MLSGDVPATRTLPRLRRRRAATYDGIDPDDEFDYDEFVREEFGTSPAGPRPRHMSVGWWLVAVVLLVCFLLGLLRLGAQPG